MGEMSRQDLFDGEDKFIHIPGANHPMPAETETEVGGRIQDSPSDQLAFWENVRDELVAKKSQAMDMVDALTAQIALIDAARRNLMVDIIHQSEPDLDQPLVERTFDMTMADANEPPFIFEQGVGLDVVTDYLDKYTELEGIGRRSFLSRLETDGWVLITLQVGSIARTVHVVAQ